MASSADFGDAVVMKALHQTIPPATNESMTSFERSVPFEQWAILLPKQKIEQYPEIFGHLLRSLRSNFGGYSYDREVSGSWVERSSGVVHSDASLIILVAVPAVSGSRNLLKLFLANAARDLAEFSIFASITGGATFFIWAAMGTASSRVDQMAA